ncbi:MAG: response regulator [Anaerolineae bacterium]|nr:response regulator [Anaerolineae bacterium]
MTKPTILVAEDDAFLRTLFAKSFRKAGFEVLTATTGDEALNQLNRALPHILTLDLGLPGVGGLDILRYIRRHEAHLDEAQQDTVRVRVIVVTGDTSAHRSEVGTLADLVLLKPVSVSALITMADRLNRRVNQAHNAS